MLYIIFAGSLKSPVRVAQGEGQAEASTSGRGTISGRGSSQGGRGGGRKVRDIGEPSDMLYCHLYRLSVLVI